ncbi:hypothetical protein [Microbacterium schleiferi]|uniref:hypothetical protein n=1 Tax=Microbacterium schleiferi TaxID=69362 RepID=UPI00311FC5F4
MRSSIVDGLFSEKTKLAETIGRFRLAESRPATHSVAIVASTSATVASAVIPTP